jgi:leader peptidase (prepilin peptidase) / N-methyltransferase
VTDLLTIGVVAAVSGVTGFGVPLLIRRLPEPEPDSDVDLARPASAASVGEPILAVRSGTRAVMVDDRPKERYTDMAAARHLGTSSAIAGTVVGGLIGVGLGPSWSLVLWLPLVPIGIALAVIDWRTHLLPTKLIQPAYLIVGLGVMVAGIATGRTDDALRALYGLLLAGGLYLAMWLLYSRGMGFGDVRLSGIIGLALGYLGWGELLVGIYAGFLLGAIGGGALALFRVVKRQAFPFGPFMLIGALVGMLGGDELWSLFTVF